MLSWKSDKLILSLSGIALGSFVAFVYLLLVNFGLISRIHYTSQDPIGRVLATDGDTRIKWEGQLQWSPLNPEQTLYENARVFSGARSQSELFIDGIGRLTVGPDSLVVLKTKDRQERSLNLDFGSFMAKLTGDDSKFGVSKESRHPNGIKNSAVSDPGKNKKIEIQVISGTARIDGENLSRTLKANEVFIAESDGENEPGQTNSQISEKPPIETKKILPLRPEDRKVYYLEPGETLKFSWQTKGALNDDSFTFHYRNPIGETLSQPTETAKATTLTIDREGTYSWQVRSSSGVQSPSQIFLAKFVRPPLLVYPPSGQVFPAQDRSTEITLVGKTAAGRLQVEVAAGNDENFSAALFSSANIKRDRIKLKFKPGEYLWRMRTEFPTGRLSAWSAPSSFIVQPPVLAPPENDGQLTLVYSLPEQLPKHLSAKNKPAQKNYLANRTSLKDFFSALNKPESSQLEIKELNTNQIFPLRDKEWPQNMIRLGRTEYSYRLQQKNYLPSPWSKARQLQLVLPPPVVRNTSNGQTSTLSLSETATGPIEQTISWHETFLTDGYEVHLSESSEFDDAKIFYTSKPSRRFALAAGREYYWRVRSLDKKKQAINRFSSIQKIFIPDRKPSVPRMADPSEDKAEAGAKRKTASSSPNTISAPIENTEQNLPRGWNFWGWLGSGYNALRYDQTVDEKANLSFTSAKGPGYYFNAGLFSPLNLGLSVGYKTTPGEVESTGDSLVSTAYNWNTLSAEVLYLIPRPFHFFGKTIYSKVRTGVQRHQVPLLNLNSNDELDLLKSNISMASLGFELESTHKAWTYQLFMRYQYPFTTTADGSLSFEIEPRFSFDGSVGLSYALSHRYRLGLYWYGQWLNYNFSYADADVSNAGSQSLFFSNVDLRLGFEF